MKHFTPDEINLVYRMCGRNSIDPVFTADVFNVLLKYGNKFSLKDAVEIQRKNPIEPQKFKPLNGNTRTYLIYKRHK